MWLAWPPFPMVPTPASRALEGELVHLTTALVDLCPVCVLAPPGDAAAVSLLTGVGVHVLAVSQPHCRLRRYGPLFARGPEGVVAEVGPEAADGCAGLLEGLNLPIRTVPVDFGGFIDVDGEGLALASESLLVHMGRIRAERLLRDLFGIDRVVWLLPAREGGGITEVARLLRPGLALLQGTPAAEDDNAARLRQAGLMVVELPRPRPRRGGDGRAVVQSYADGVLTARVVILPAFEDGADQTAVHTAAAASPRPVVSFPCAALVESLGGLGALVLVQPQAG